ncbi:hypothetical protein SUGI_0359790 [Cryptomeria japonica]|nr:hypothetical protein SUGI_0359790 [Cryptomeria japonica]
MVHKTLDLMPAHIFLDARKPEQELQDFYQGLQPEDMRSMLKDSICKHDSILNSNPKLLQQMHLDDLAEHSDMEEGFTYSVHAIASVKSQFYVGLEKAIGDLKRPFFQNEVVVVGVQFMGGVGKTTLALALCTDDHIKGRLQNLLFITVSESPYVKGVLETMWDCIVVRKKSQLQNVKDASMQLQVQLLRQSKSALLILDKVRSRSNLKKLLFQVAGYKTLFTTRDISIIPRNHCSQFYQLPLLGQEDALSLFCLHGEPCEAWQSTKNKISKRELVSDYHINGLLRFMETNIRYPEDKKNSADSLLHNWIYVRKLECLEAICILLELASRKLLNLTNNPRSTAAISYGNASELYFSQYYVMRDLALQFRRPRHCIPEEEVTCAQEGGYFAMEVGAAERYAI